MTDEEKKERRRISYKKYYEKNKNKRNENSRLYCIINKEKMEIYSKNYKIDNKEKIKKYYDDNKETILLKNKEYRKINKEKLKKQKEIYYQQNKEKIKEYTEINKDRRKEYLNENKEKIRIRDNHYVKNKSLTDPLYKLKHNIRASILTTLKKKTCKKNNRTEEIIGCSFIKLKEHLENQFETWMSWDNYGKYNGEYEFGWDIDHIIELKTITTEEDLLRLNHHLNLRPLDSKINRVDRNRTPHKK